uniref:Uncharacterized protein n=1 Tax=Arundo donax TaxID=35708 RepID=A0A0A8ZSP5_ARUDO
MQQRPDRGFGATTAGSGKAGSLPFSCAAATAFRCLKQSRLWKRWPSFVCFCCRG